MADTIRIEAELASEARNRPCPQPGLFETIAALRATGTNYLALIDRLQERYGDFFRLRIGGAEFYVVAGPAEIESVLKADRGVFVKNPLITREMKSLGPESIAVCEGAEWQLHRRLTQPPFRPTALAGHTTALADALVDLKSRWDDSSMDVRRIDVDSADFTFSVMTRMMLGEALPEHEARIREGLETEIECLTKRIASPIPMPHWAPTPNQIRLRRAQRALDEAVRDIVQRAESTDARGFAADWLRAYGELDDDHERVRTRVRDQLMTMLTGGHQTASFGLAYCLHQIAADPEVGDRLKREAREVLHGRTPGPGDLAALPFARSVVLESLRLFPVLPVVVRKVAQPFDLGGVELPKGANVAISIWSAHRHPQHWSEPERFDPDRFRKAHTEGRHPGAYLPFSLGARSCLARDFALLELTSAVAYLSQFFTLAPDPDSTLRVVPKLALAPERDVRIRVLRDRDRR